MTCFACEREPTRQCPRCGRPYCDEHGEDVCDACLHPASGVPSFTLYRGSLLALLIGTALAVYFIFQTPGSESSSAVKPIVLTPTAVARNGVATTPGAGGANGVITPLVPAGTPGGSATPAAATTPAAGATPGALTTPAAGATPSTAATSAAGTTPATGTTPAASTTTYTVVSGDNLTSICQSVKPASMSTSDCVDRIVALNKLSSSNASISIGQVLTVPK